MDFVLLSLVQLLAHSIVSLIPTIFALLLRVLYTHDIHEQSQTRDLDAEIMKSRPRITQSSGTVEAPGNGWYLVFRANVPCIVVRTTTAPDRHSNGNPQYKVYTLSSRAMQTFMFQIKENTLSMVICTSLTPWNWHTTRLSREIPIGDEFVYQSEAIDRIIESWKTRGRCMCLLYGPPGCGKTTTAEYVVRRIQNTQCKPTIITGMSLITVAVDPFAVLPIDIKPGAPQVLCLNEIDAAFEWALAGKTTRDITRIAENKTSLNDFLDRAARTPGLILIATTNKTLKELQDNFPAFIRSERFHIVFGTNS